MKLEFEAPKKTQAPIIKAFGVGGLGGNAVDYMFNQNVMGVEYIVCNTDYQDLEKCSVPNKLQIGKELTKGLGAGCNPSIGRDAAEESIQEIKEALSDNTKMIFVTAGMGGGTGTGAAPIIAGVAKDMGILTIGIVTIPARYEGKRKKDIAQKGVEDMRNNVDSLIIIDNAQLPILYPDCDFNEAYNKANDVLSTATKGISDIILIPGNRNLDFADVRTTMLDGGTALMGRGVASGDGRATKAVNQALSSPLLNDQNITGAENILVYVTVGNTPISQQEYIEMTDRIYEEVGEDVLSIYGDGVDESLGDDLAIIFIATKFKATSIGSDPQSKKQNVLKMDVNPVPQQEQVVIEQQAIVEESPAQKPVKPKQNKIVFNLEGNQISQNPNVEDSAEVDTQELEVKEVAPSAPSLFPKEGKRDEVRDSRLSEMSEYNMQDYRDIDELESVPAYIRRNVNIDNKTVSSDDKSSFKLYDQETGEIIENSFLHDNVD